MQWTNDSTNAGFSNTTAPWIEVPKDANSDPWNVQVRQKPNLANYYRNCKAKERQFHNNKEFTSRQLFVLTRIVWLAPNLVSADYPHVELTLIGYFSRKPISKCEMNLIIQVIILQAVYVG